MSYDDVSEVVSAFERLSRQDRKEVLTEIIEFFSDEELFEHLKELWEKEEPDIAFLLGQIVQKIRKEEV